MKNFIIILFCAFCQLSFAQMSSGLTYQGYLISEEGTPLENKAASFTISISSDASNNNAYFSEVQDISTNENGIFNLIIGEGIPLTGNISDVDWLASIPYVTISYDLMDGEGDQSLGTTQFNSVPFCFSSEYVICQAGAKGPQGVQGERGIQGEEGFQGVQGEQGLQGIQGNPALPILPLLNTPPITNREGHIYMDDGTNRDDDAPGFRYYDGNGWIDL